MWKLIMCAVPHGINGPIEHVDVNCLGIRFWHLIVVCLCGKKIMLIVHRIAIWVRELHGHTLCMPRVRLEMKLCENACLPWVYDHLIIPWCVLRGIQIKLAVWICDHLSPWCVLRGVCRPHVLWSKTMPSTSGRRPTWCILREL